MSHTAWVWTADHYNYDQPLGPWLPNGQPNQEVVGHWSAIQTLQGVRTYMHITGNFLYSCKVVLHLPSWYQISCRPVWCLTEACHIMQSSSNRHISTKTTSHKIIANSSLCPQWQEEIIPLGKVSVVSIKLQFWFLAIQGMSIVASQLGCYSRQKLDKALQVRIKLYNLGQIMAEDFLYIVQFMLWLAFWVLPMQRIMCFIHIFCSMALLFWLV